jgi:hypothetical protein
VDDVLHRVGLRLGFRFATGSASSFSIRTGLAGTTTLHPFALPRFWSCYRSPGGFPPEVRPFVLKGISLSTFSYFVGIQLAVRRRTNPYVLQFSRCWSNILTEEGKSGNARDARAKATDASLLGLKTRSLRRAQAPLCHSTRHTASSWRVRPVNWLL